MSEFLIESLEIHIRPILQTLRLAFDVYYLTKGTSIQFVVNDFGTIICGLDRNEYSGVNDVVESNFPGYRKVFFSSFDDPLEKKDEIIWALMSGGYMRWLRFTFPRQFTNSIVMENLGNRIIDERLKRWNDKAMFKSFIDDNKDARVNSASYILSIDPGFFDYMPENI